MRAGDGAVTGGKGGEADAIHAEEGEGEAGADDIGDGIEGADLVEVDGLGGGLVDGGFGFGEAREDGDGLLFNRGWQGAFVDDG